MQQHPTNQRTMSTKWSQIQLYVDNIFEPFAEFTQSIAHQRTKSSGLCKISIQILSINLPNIFIYIIYLFIYIVVCTYEIWLKAFFFVFLIYR